MIHSRCARGVAVFLLLAWQGVASTARAQDTTVALPSSSAARVAPLSPKRAFLTSLLIPGYGQTKLDRGSAAALFATVELGAFAMLRQSLVQLNEARRFQNDSLPIDFTVRSDGTIVPRERSEGGFTEALIRTRRLHVEDWLAVLAFNHLLAGADAFVSAQLWDVRNAVSIAPSPRGGWMLVATVSW